MPNSNSRSSFRHLGKIFPTTSPAIVAQNDDYVIISTSGQSLATSPAIVTPNGSATSSFQHVGKIILSKSPIVVAQNGGAMSSFWNMGNFPLQVEQIAVPNGSTTLSFRRMGKSPQQVRYLWLQMEVSHHHFGMWTK